MDPQNPNSTDSNNSSIINPVPGVSSPISPTPIQPDLNSILSSTPPPVDPIPKTSDPNLTNIPSMPLSTPTQSEPANIATPTSDSSQIPTYTPPSWMNPAATAPNPEPTVPNPMPNASPSTIIPSDNLHLASPNEVNPTTPPVEPIPTYVPPASPIPTSEMAPQPAPIQSGPESTPVGPNPLTSPDLSPGAPVDLSQLISNAQQQVQANNPTGMPPSSPPSPAETVVNAAPTATTEAATSGSRGFPKWLIGIAAGLLILVLGASAYFILGVGQNNTQTSLPATQTTGGLATPAPIPSPRSVVPTPVPSIPPATSSAQPASTPQATSAADLIRLRQQGK